MHEQQATIQLDSTEFSLTYRESSSSNEQAAVFLIHGIGDCKEDWQAMFQAPISGEFRLIAVDLLGFGKSAKPKDLSYDLFEHAQACRQLIDQLELQQVHIVAHSVGGAVAVLLASMLHKRLLSFTSVEGNLVSEDCGIITRQVSAMSLEDYKSNELPARSKRLQNAGRDPYPNEVMLPEAFHRTAYWTVQWSDSNVLLCTLLNLPCHKTYIYGDANKEYAVLKQLNRVQLVEISGSGHRPMDDNPQELYKALQQILGD